MRKLFLALALFATASTASAQDWPKFLGPTGDSKSTQTNLLRECGRPGIVRRQEQDIDPISS